MTCPSHAGLARVVRSHAGQLATSLVHLTGDFAVAEDLVQDAIEAALRHWPAEGIPERPDSWVYTVARAELLRDLGHPDQARAADERALTLTANPAERSLLRQRLNWT